jgi:putative ABC transport system permease protein
MGRAAANAALDMEGAFNDLVLTTESGADVADIIGAVDRTLVPYGGLGAYDRSEQVSHRFISDELKQNRMTGMVVPTIFLGIAAFLLNVVLSRLVATQRDQIAVLKAFGYDNKAVSIHYLKLALVAVAGGALAGVLLGQWLASWQIVLYSRFYRFPDIHSVIDGTAAVIAVLVTSASGLLGALGAVRAAVRLPPAEAMRPEAPSQFRAGLFERLGLARFTRPASRIIVRSLARRPIKAILSIVGIGWAVAILIVGRQLVDSILYLARFQFGVVQREDVTVTFNAPRPGRIRHELTRLPGVMRSEPFRAAPARLRSDYRSRLVPLLGLGPGSELRRLVDRRGREVDLPREGIVLTTKLAEVLGVGVGDVITAEVLEGERPTRPILVTGTVDELIGLSAYMDLAAVNRMLREGDIVSGAFLSVDPNRANALYRQLKRTSIGAGIGRRDAALASFTTTLAESLGIMTTILVTLACLLAVALIYNVGRIALSERGRELASLRVLGFTRREVAAMLLGEQAFLTVAALPLGLALGYLASALITRAYQWELYRLPMVVSSTTYAAAAAIIMAAAIASGAIVRRRLDRLDLVAVLKTRE